MYVDDTHKHAGTVLCIDPDRGNLRVMERNLSHMGYVVLKETSTRRGLQMAVQEHPDVILVDVEDGDLSQEDLQSLYHSTPELADTPVIALARNWDSDQLIECCTSINCRVRLPKPAGRSMLLKAVQQLATGRNRAGV